LSTPPDNLKRKLVLNSRGEKGFLRVSRNWMIRLGWKFDNVLVSQVKTGSVDLNSPRPHVRHPRFESYDLWLDPGMRDVVVASNS
jgi:hypothetical protein